MERGEVSMSKTVDDRIVRMSFDTNKFQNGVKGVLDGLKSIDKSLDSDRKFRGLDNIGRTIADVTGKGMGGLAKSIDEASGRFSALEVAGITALANITNMAVNAGMNLVKSLTLNPIMDGFREYELKMNSIQTILTNTKSKGTTLDDVNKALAELNEYSDQTIYNFAQMTDSIGKATAAGVGLEDSVTFVKGLANVAAGFGVDATSMAGATQQMTQALSSGVFRLQDWMSMEQRGMAGEMLQDSLKATAKEMGIYVNESIPFRDTLKDNWLSSEVFIKTMDKMAKDQSLIDAAQNVTSFTKLLDTLGEAVGTGWADLFEIIIGNKEESTKLFTDISNSITNNFLGPIQDMGKKVATVWKDMGGRTNLIQAFINIFENLGRILGPIGQAFAKVFPKTFGETLAKLTLGFRDLTYAFMVSEDFSKFIGDAFTGLFKIINGGIKVVGALLKPLDYVFRFLVDIGRTVGSTIVAFLKMTYAIGDYIRELTFVKEAQSLFNSGLEFIQKNVEKFLTAFDNAAKNLRKFFGKIISGINGLFGVKDKTDDVSKSLDTVVKSSNNAEKAMDGVKTVGDFVARSFGLIKKAGDDVKTIFYDAKEGAENAADGFITFLNNTKDYILNSSIVARATETMVEAWETMCEVGDRIKGFVQSIDFSPIANTIQAVKDKLSPIVTYITNIFDTVVSAFKSVFDELDLTGGQLIALLGGFAAGFGVFKILGSIGDLIGKILNPVGNLSDAAVGVLDGVRGCLESYQNRIQAETLKSIGVAVLFLSGGLLILSQLELSQVQSGLLGVVGILASVVGALAILIKITSDANLKGFFAISSSFVTLSIAVFNMSIAVMLLSSLGMEKLATGLIGIAGGLTMMVLAIGAVSTMTGRIVAGSFALLLLANALKSMFLALFLFSKMDISEMNNSLMSVGMALGILVFACRKLDDVTGNIPKIAFGLMLLASSVILLATACKKFGNMDPDVLKQGLLSVTIIIGALTIFSKATEKSKMSFSMGAGMMAFAKALNMLYKPIKKFGELDVAQLAKGITSLGLVMAGVTLMTNKLKPKTGWQLAQVSAGLILFSQAIKMFCKTAVDLKYINTGDMLNGLLNLSLAIGAVGLATALIPERQLGMLALGIGALAIAFKILIPVIEKAGEIPFGNMLKGFVALAGGLLVLEYATRLTSETDMILLGIGLSAIALGFTAMMLPLQKLGSLDFQTLAKGLGSILSMVGILTLMNMGMVGMKLAPLAGGLTLMAGALTALVLPIKLMGGLDLKTIGIGLLGIVGVLAVLAGAAFLMTPLVPVLFGLATSIGLLGSGMLAAAGGLALFSGGFALFATSVGLFGDELLAFFVAFGQKLPELVESAALAFIKLLEVLGQNGTLISESVYNIFVAVTEAIIKVIPLVAEAAVNLIITLLETLQTQGGRLVEAGYNLIMALLDGINKYVTPVIDKMIEILITMADALVNNAVILIDAGITLIINLINGIAEGIESNSEAFAEAVNNLIFSVLDALVGFGVDFFKRGVGFVGEMIGGLFDKEKDVEKTSTDVAEAGVEGAESTQKQWTAAGKEFSAGIESGIASGRTGVMRTATNLARDAANSIKKELDINSPSRVTTEYGMFTSKGLAVGISKFGYLATRAGSKVAEDTVRSIEKPMNNISLLDGINGDPVVRPVLDLSNIKSGSRTIGELINNAAGTISSFGSINTGLVTNVGNIQNGKDNSDIVGAISKLRKDINNIKGTTNIIEGITYDDGSAISNTLSDLVRMARVERRR